jgi:hypothetical protein
LLEMFRVTLNEASILLIHHTTKDGFSYRGSSVTPAAVDGLIESKSDGLMITLTSAGFKDAAEFETFTVRCESVAIETEDGAEDVLVVKDRNSVTDILNQPFAEIERPARKLVQVMVEHFPDGATNVQLQKQCGMTETTFNRARKLATKEKGWLVGGGGRGVLYQLNSDGSWREALGVTFTSITPPLKGVEVKGSEGGHLHGGVMEVSGSDSDSAIPKSEKPAKTETDQVEKASELLKKVGRG